MWEEILWNFKAHFDKGEISYYLGGLHSFPGVGLFLYLIKKLFYIQKKTLYLIITERVGFSINRDTSPR